MEQRVGGVGYRRRDLLLNMTASLASLAMGYGALSLTDIIQSSPKLEFPPAYVKDFYNGATVHVPYEGYIDGQVRSGGIEIALSDRQRAITQEEVLDKVKQVEWKVLEYNGSRFEVAWLPDAKAGKENAQLHISTLSASISTNEYNLMEFAYQALVNPDIPQIYVASFGNGHSSVLSGREQDYARATGRLTWERYGKMVALPTVQNLVGALALSGMHITRLGTYSAGSWAGVAVGAALPKGQVIHTAYSSRPQLCEQNPLSLAQALYVTERLEYAPAAKDTTPDKWPARNIHLSSKVKQARQDIYNDAVQGDYRPERLGMMATNSVAMSHGLSALAGDLSAFIRQQPEATINFIVAEHDPIYTNMLEPNIAVLTGRFAKETQPRSLRVITVPGVTHTFNQHYPQLYQAILAPIPTLPYPS